MQGTVCKRLTELERVVRHLYQHSSVGLHVSFRVRQVPDLPTAASREAKYHQRPHSFFNPQGSKRQTSPQCRPNLRRRRRSSSSFVAAILHHYRHRFRVLLDSVMNNKPFENPSNPAGNATGMTYKRAAVLAAGIGAVAWYIAARRDTRKPPTEDFSGDPMHATKPVSDNHKQH